MAWYNTALDVGKKVSGFELGKSMYDRVTGGPSLLNPDDFGEQNRTNSSAAMLGGNRYANMDLMNRSRNAYRGAMEAGQTRESETMDTGQYDQVRGQQQQLLGALQDQASDRSMAQMQLREGGEAAIAAQRSAAAGARGMNPMLAQRMMTENIGNIQSQVGRDSAMLQAQQTAQANQMRAGVMGQMAGQDIGIAGQNLGAGVQQQAQRDQLLMDAMKTGMSFEEANRQAQMQLAAFKAADFENAQSRRLAAATGNQQAQTQHAGAVFSMGGAMLSGLAGR
jgi:hypothetical protein